MMNQSKKYETLVLIDDDSVYLMLCLRTIERSGKFKKVLSFKYADEALAYIENNPEEKIDLIFLDINMPRMSGFEFLNVATEKLKEQFRAKVVIMLTTSIDVEDIEKSKNFPNIKGYLAKPLTDDRLERSIDLIQNTKIFTENEIIMIDTDHATFNQNQS